MSPERRASRRTKMVLSVKVSLVSGMALAHTIDISYAGARLGALREQLQPGEIIALTRGSQKAKSRIVWVRQLSKHEFHAGLEALQRQEQFREERGSAYDPAESRIEAHQRMRL